MDTYTITEELLEVVFSTQPVPRLYNKGQWDQVSQSQTVMTQKYTGHGSCTAWKLQRLWWQGIAAIQQTHREVSQDILMTQSVMSQKNTIMDTVGPGTENDFAGKGQQQLTWTTHQVSQLWDGRWYL
jgi:hypothetical protein